MHSPANHRNLELVGHFDDGGQVAIDFMPTLDRFGLGGVATGGPLHEGRFATAAAKLLVGGRDTVRQQVHHLLREVVETLFAVFGQVRFVRFVDAAELFHSICTRKNSVTH